MALTPLQLEERRKGIGGSDAAAILGLHPFRGPMQVWLDKRGALPDEMSHAAEMGLKLEPAVISLFEAETGLRVRPAPDTLHHKDEPILLANLDGVVPEVKAVFEAKTSSSRASWGDSAIPEYHMVQVQHYMGVTGLERAFVAALTADRGFDFVVREVERDDKLIAQLFTIELDWWHSYIETDTPPPVDVDEPHINDMLRYLYPTAEGEVDLTNDNQAEVAARLYLQAAEAKKLAAAEQDRAKAALLGLMGTAKVAHVGSIRVTRSIFDQTRVDTERLKEAGLYDAYTRSVPAMKLTVSEKGE